MNQENLQLQDDTKARIKSEIPEYIFTNKRARRALGIRLTPRRVEKEPGRNDLCSCDSGKKYKHCCWGMFDFTITDENGRFI